MGHPGLNGCAPNQHATDEEYRIALNGDLSARCDYWRRNKTRSEKVRITEFVERMGGYTEALLNILGPDGVFFYEEGVGSHSDGYGGYYDIYFNESKDGRKERLRFARMMVEMYGQEGQDDK